MVGVPRSKGCHLCVKRRVRCDEGRPTCGNCSRYGASCPGYERSRKFVDNKHRVRPRRDREPRSNGSSSPGSSESSTTVVLAPRPTIPAAPRTDRGQYITNLLGTLYLSVKSSEMIFLSPWFVGIEELLGAKVTLDSAVMSLILQILGKAHNDAHLVGESLSLYARSLSSLQASLNHPTEWKSAETLCTTIMMCYFEMFAGTTNDTTWMVHAGAIGSLIRQRGPSAFVDGWEAAVLRSFRVNIIMYCFFIGQDCFLAEPAWQKVLMRTSFQGDNDPLKGQQWYLINTYVAILAKIPGIMLQIYPLHEARLKGLPLPDLTDGVSLATYIQNLYDDLLDCESELHRLIPGPREVQSQDAKAPWPTMLTYETVWFGALYMGFWTTQLILREGLRLLEGHVALTGESLDLVAKVLRSVEMVGEGVMGPYRIGYGLRVTYDMADAPTREWLRTKLRAYQKTYAGLQEQSFRSLDEMPWTAQ